MAMPIGADNQMQSWIESGSMLRNRGSSTNSITRKTQNASYIEPTNLIVHRRCAAMSR